MNQVHIYGAYFLRFVVMLSNFFCFFLSAAEDTAPASAEPAVEEQAQVN